MKNFLAKIWFPALLVVRAAFQSFGIDASRVLKSAFNRNISDSTQTRGDSILAVDSTVTLDSLVLSDSLAALDSIATPDTLAARDTIRIPDSLQFTDPFFFKYYIAVKDSTLYTTFSPCLLCAKMIINAGIREVVYRRHYSIDDVSTRLLLEAGVKIRAVEEENKTAEGCSCHES